MVVRRCVHLDMYKNLNDGLDLDQMSLILKHDLSGAIVPFLACEQEVVGWRPARVNTGVAWFEHLVEYSLAINQQGFTPLRCK